MAAQLTHTVSRLNTYGSFILSNVSRVVTCSKLTHKANTKKKKKLKIQELLHPNDHLQVLSQHLPGATAVKSAGL